jgi:hypothetical protein
MGHIHAPGGRFVTVLPRSRAEDKYFRDWAQTRVPTWTEAIRLSAPAARSEDDEDELDAGVFTFPAPLPTAEGYRLLSM